MNEVRKKRVVVAMSGGVDSSVAALLLKNQGYDVIGISMKLWDGQADTTFRKTCCSLDDINDARAVCYKLGIPFYAFNYKEEFAKKVVTPFVSEYRKGRTPNPCILCNKHMKFDRLLSEALKLGADYVATGHHAQLAVAKDGIYRLLKGVDPHKDQSYVLYQLSQGILKKLLLPVGPYTKAAIRQIAMDHSLPTADKHESQDICFVPDGDHGRFVKEFDQKPSHEGDFVTASGQILGRHKGIEYYTVGQRRGLGIAHTERYYVIEIRPGTHEVVLGGASALHRCALVATEVSWVNHGFKGSCMAKLRYQKDEIPVHVQAADKPGDVFITIKNPGPAISPGQAIVFYQGNEVLGGGTIQP